MGDRHAEDKPCKRTVPLPGWLARGWPTTLRTHPNADNPTAVLWPATAGHGQRATGHCAAGLVGAVRLNGVQSKVTRPWRRSGCRSLAQPAVDDAGRIPATKGVRLHDLRHTAAALWLTAGVHFMQVAKWLGHASYVLTMTTMPTGCPTKRLPTRCPNRLRLRARHTATW